MALLLFMAGNDIKFAPINPATEPQGQVFILDLVLFGVTSG
jgi:hypothetical protein